MEADIYSADDMKSMYQEIPEEVLVENEIIIAAEVKNISDEERTFNLSPFTLQIRMEHGGIFVFKSGSKREHCPRKRRNENSDACFPDRKRRIGSGRTDKADPGAISGEI